MLSAHFRGFFPNPFNRLCILPSVVHHTYLCLFFTGSNPNKTFQPRSYANPARCYHGKPERGPVMNMKTQPSSRPWSAYAIPAAVMGFVGLATLFHFNDERRAIPKGGGGNNCAGSPVMGPKIGGPFTLVDTENQVVTEKTLLGNWILLYFGYTSSPTLGPQQVDMMAKAVDILELKQSSKVLPVFVTIDPQRDTPSHLHAYLKEFDSRIIGLTGPSSAIRQMAQEYRVFFKKVEEDGDDYLIESSNIMYLMNPKMEIVRCFGAEYSAQDLAEAIFKELKSSPT